MYIIKLTPWTLLTVLALPGGNRPTPPPSLPRQSVVFSAEGTGNIPKLYELGQP